MNKKNYYLIGFLVFLIALFALSINNEKKIDESKSDLNKNLEIELPDKITDPNEIILEKPKTSWAGTMSNITIDDTGGTFGAYTWDQAKDQAWCTLKGSVYYIENVTINAGASPTGSGILIKNSNNKNFIIRNCSITNAPQGSYPANVNGGIKLVNVSNGQISYNNLSLNGHSGLSVYNCKNITMDNNLMYGPAQEYGIFMRFTNESLIFNNTADYNQHVGIFLQRECQYNNITNNNASHNSLNYGIALYDNSSYNRIVNNTANYNGMDGIVLRNATMWAKYGFGCHYNTILNNTANKNNAYGIDIMGNSDFNKILDNTACLNAIGITLRNYMGTDGTNDNNIIDNNIANDNNIYGIWILNENNNNNFTNNILSNVATTDQDIGIYFQGGGNCNVINNTANGNNDYGVDLYLSHNNNIINNTINNNKGGTDNKDMGIYLQGSTYNKIINNTVNNNGNDGDESGIYLRSSSHNNTIHGNTIKGNFDNGIYFTFGCDENNITGNIITNNAYGIAITAIGGTSYDNIIIGNNFTGNTVSIYDVGTNTIEAMNCIEGVCTPLIIDDSQSSANSFTWAEVIMHVPWFKGSGIPDDPYIIENIKIKGRSPTATGALFIRNTGYFTVRNCEIYNGSSGWNAGLCLLAVHNATIINNNISNNQWDGILVSYSADVRIHNNTIYNNVHGGIRVGYGLVNINITSNDIRYTQVGIEGRGDSDNIYIAYNTIRDTSAQGISIWGTNGNSDNNIIFNNSIYSNTGDGILLYEDCYFNVIVNNTIRNNNGYGICLTANCSYNNITGNIIEYNGNSGIYLTGDCNNNQIINNTANNNYANGLYLFTNCHNNTIAENTFNENGDASGEVGIRLDTNCDDNTIDNNTIIDNWHRGIQVNLYCDNNNITNNLILNTVPGLCDVGIRIDNYCDNNNIINNTANGHEYFGISLAVDCDGNTILNNTCNNNGGDGIRLETNCDNNNITGNMINNNGLGVGITTSNCINNIVVGNILNGNGITDSGSATKKGMNCIDGVCTPLTIDDNGGTTGALTWAEAILHIQWFKGSGTSNDPYIIEDIEINPSLGTSGSGLLIIDSDGKYFIIRDCTIYDAASGVYPSNIYGCIRLENSNKGQIYSNDLTSTTGGSQVNGGLVLYSCTNIIIINNTLDGSRYGLFMRYSNENLIFNNSADYSHDVGIFLQVDCNYNNITQNSASYTADYYGIALYTNSNNNNIINNTVTNNGYDRNNNDLAGIILLSGCIDNNIINNTVTQNYDHGIYLKTNCHYNTIRDNTAEDNGDDAIRLYNNCDDNKIIHNSASESISDHPQDIGICIETGCDRNTILNNTCNNNPYGIVIWDNNDNNIISGNIINTNTITGIYINDATSNTNIIIGNTLNGNGIIDSSSDTREGMNKIDGMCTPLIIDDDGGTANSFTWAEVLMYVLWFSGAGSWGDPYIIEDIAVDAEGSGSGLTVIDSSVPFIIRNCNITGSGSTGAGADGIGDAGIKLYKVNNSRIIDNNCSFNHNAIILNTYCYNNTILGNTANNNSAHGIVLWNFCYNNTIFGNKVWNNLEIGIYLEGQGPRYCWYNNITGNSIYNNLAEGILLRYYCAYNTISDNNCTYNNIGVFVYAWGSSDNSVIGNNLSYNVESGIRLQTGAARTNIIGNILSFNYYGIYYVNPSSNDANIKNNQIFNNSEGIHIENDNNNNEIYNNNIYNNTAGIRIISANADNTLIYNNTFINNADHAYDVGTNTMWNNTQIGNYWDDYFTAQNGKDVNDDGIGDSWYIISGSKYDKLPIWWDAPIISIISPAYLDFFGNATINFTLSIDKTTPGLSGVYMWYMLVNYTNPADKTNIQFFDASQYPIHYILYNLWNMFENGKINIWFYVNDSRGYIGYANVTIEKNMNIPTISLISIGFYGVGGVSTINFTVALDGPAVHTFWYRIHNKTEWSQNYTHNAIVGQLNIEIDSTLWAWLPNGTFDIEFFLNDTKAIVLNKTSLLKTVKKDIEIPQVIINSPSNYEFFGKDNPPTITFNIIEPHLHQIWYNLNDGARNYTYRDDIENEIKRLTEGWGDVVNGSIIIKFWANDTGGNVNYTIVSLYLWKDIYAPVNIVINTPDPTVQVEYKAIAPPYSITFDEPNFAYFYYVLFDQSNSYFSPYITKTTGFIDQLQWDQLNNDQINITFYVYDKAGNYGSESTYIIKQAPTSDGALTPAAADDDDDDDDDDGEDETMDWIIRALLAGLISGSVGITLRIAYSKIKKKREAAREAAKPTIILKKKYQTVHHDFLTPYGKVEKKEFRVGIAQLGLSKTGNLITELFEMTPAGLMRIREDQLEAVSANIKSLIEQAHENNVNILLFPEMTFDLNYKSMVKDAKKWAQEYNMYIITGGYHDIKTKQNICAVFGPEGIQWNQEKHTPATIHFGKKVFTEAIEIQHPPHKLHICATEYGRIAIAICRDFLDMDLRVEIKNCEPPVDLFFNPAYTPVTVDFEATHFDARRSVYAYTFFANVAEYGGTIINTPEKDRTKRTIPPKEEGLIFKDVDLFSLRSERDKWERRQSKEKRYIQSTRS